MVFIYLFACLFQLSPYSGNTKRGQLGKQLWTNFRSARSSGFRGMSSSFSHEAPPHEVERLFVARLVPHDECVLPPRRKEASVRWGPPRRCMTSRCTRSFSFERCFSIIFGWSLLASGYTGMYGVVTYSQQRPCHQNAPMHSPTITHTNTQPEIKRESNTLHYWNNTIIPWDQTEIEVEIRVKKVVKNHAINI